VSAGIGVILGALLIFLTKTVVFAMGFLVGVLISSFVLATPVGLSLFSTKNYLPLIAMGLSGIAGGAITFLLKKYVMMFACALLGATALAFSVDCAWLKTDLISLIPNIIALQKVDFSGNSTPYIVLAGIGGLTLGGFGFQLYWKHKSKHPTSSQGGYELVPKSA